MTFEKLWPALEKEVHDVLTNRNLAQQLPTKRQQTDLIEELLLRVRNIQRMVENTREAVSAGRDKPKMAAATTPSADRQSPSLEARKVPAGVSGRATSACQSVGAPPPMAGLGVFLPKPPSAASGCLGLAMRIDNKTDQFADLATVTLRYWYQDRGLGTELILNSDYVSIGYSNKGKVLGVKSIPCPGLADATHYLEFSFKGTLAPKGDKEQNDLFTVNVSVHNSGYSGKVDVTSDYSYNSGATGYNDRITLHGGGELLWGTPPGARK